ncbi:MAG: efflux RND transporter periplasmic adaptor subunit [Myxococcota bacterium]
MPRCSKTLLFLVWLVGCSSGADEEAPPVPVKCVLVTTGTAETSVVLRGQVRPPPDKDALVSASVAGTIATLPVREGDPVVKGTMLATLDERTFYDDVRQAKTGIEQAAAGAAAAAAADARKSGLLQQGVVSRADADTARADAARAKAELAASETTLDSAYANLDRARMRSPIDGIVVRVYRQVGEVVDGTPGQPVVEVADPTHLELRAEVPVAQLISLKVGMPARVTVDPSVPAVGGHVASVSPAVSMDTGLGVVRIALDDGSGLPIGAIATATVVIGSRPNCAMVPADALRGGEGGGLEAVVCADGKAKVVAVQAGEKTEDGSIPVTDGLAPGDQIVAGGGVGIDAETPLECTP